jgi:uncharacterized SAM-binding protein YcdF (DUF218 family)
MSGTVVVVPGCVCLSDSSARMEKAVYLFRQNRCDRLIIVGTEPEVRTMRDFAHRANIPDEVILSSSESKTTFDNAFYAKSMFSNLPSEKVILVVSEFQATRTWRIFKGVFGEDTPIRLVKTRSVAGQSMIRREYLLRVFVILWRIPRWLNPIAIKKMQDICIKVLERVGLDQLFFAYKQTVWGERVQCQLLS